MILLAATWAFAETKTDPTKENGFTHIKRIIQFTRSTEPLKLDRSLAPLSIRFDMSKFQWKEDDVEHLQYPKETLTLKTGDCEDFTMYFLALAKITGHPIQRLGFAIIIPDKEDAHLVPLYQEDDNTWWVWESGAAIGQIAPLARYLNATLNLNYVIIFMGFDDYSTVTTLTKTHWWTNTLAIWMKNEETRIKTKGYATE